MGAPSRILRGVPPEQREFLRGVDRWAVAVLDAHGRAAQYHGFPPLRTPAAHVVACPGETHLLPCARDAVSGRV